MKKITLVLSAVVLLFGTSIAKASAEKVFDDVERGMYPPVDYRYAEPIVFMERGIEFMVLPNGEFDFNTVATTAPRPRNTTYGAPRGNAYGYYGNSNVGVRVEHDYMGRVRRIGNVYINYDNVGRVKRIGTVYMRYNSFALTQVGGLRIVYDRRGRIVNIVGNVNSSSYGYNYSPQGNHYSPSNGNYNYDDYNDDYGYNDNDFYYYRTDGTKAKMSDDDVVEIKKTEKESLDRKK